MDLGLAPVIAGCLFLVAILFSSVGHGGGSGYLAVLTLFAVAQEVMRPAALVLNIGVASIALVKFARQGAFSWRTFWPFAVTAVPLAFVGGLIHLPGPVYKPILAVVLLYSAWYLFSPRSVPDDDPDLTAPVVPALALGGVIGLLSGLTGIGGGIFLSPVLLFNHWSATRKASGVAAAFILANSIAGLAGQAATVAEIPWQAFATWLPAALVGGYVGSHLGSRRLPTKTIYRLLAVVMVIAAVKLLLTVTQ